MSLTHDDVRKIVELLESSQFDELDLESGDLKLTLRRGAAPADPPEPAPRASAVARTQAAQTGAPGAASPAGLAEVRAPLLGTFYRAPKPGAAPFVEVGTQVQPDTVVGIIEVMKLMNSVAAGQRGEVAEIFAGDGQFVEYGELLMRLRPL
jgi:acetyl-CoA carboxylase biotin carboxyl carrier protein